MMQTLNRFQRALIAIIPFLLPTTYQQYLWQATQPGAEVPELLTGAAFFFFDVPVTLLMLTVLYRLFADSDFRAGYTETLRNIVTRFAGGWWFALALLTFAGVLVGPREPVLAWAAALRMAQGLFFAMTLAHFARDDWRYFSRAFTVAAMFHGLWGIGQIINGEPFGVRLLGERPFNQTPYAFWEPTFRAYGLFNHPNRYASYMMIALFGALLLLFTNWEARRWRWMAVNIVGLLVISGGLLASSSRSVLLGVAIALIPLVLLLWRLMDRRVLLGLVGAGAAAVIVVATVTPAGALLVSRSLGILRNPDQLSDRLFYAYEDTAHTLRDRTVPAIGVGPNNLGVALSALRTDFVNPDLDPLPAHNIFLYVWAEQGIIGFFLIAIIFVSMLSRLSLRNNTALILWSSAFLALLLVMLLDYQIWSEPRTRMVLYWALGMWWGSHTLEDRALLPRTAQILTALTVVVLGVVLLQPARTSAPYYAQLGEELTAYENFEASAEAYARAVQQSRTDEPTYYYGLGKAQRLAGDAESAVAAMQIATDFDGDNADYHYELALAHNANGMPDAALTALDEAVALGFDDAVLVEVARGHTFRLQDDAEAAQSAFDAALALAESTPDRADVLVIIGDGYPTCDEAVPLYEAAFEMYNRNRDAVRALEACGQLPTDIG